MKLSWKWIRRSSLFRSSEGENFPWILHYRVAGIPVRCDVDVIIGSHGQMDYANEIIRNYRNLEKKLKIQFIVVETHPEKFHFQKIIQAEDVIGIWIPKEYTAMIKGAKNKWGASNALALAFELGAYNGKSDSIFFSHSDMMGCRENFISWIHSKLNKSTTMASFSQRHLYPFTAGMIVTRERWENFTYDSLPKDYNRYHFNRELCCKKFISRSQSVDIGEDYVNEILESKERIYISDSYGIKGRPQGHAFYDEYEIKREEHEKFPKNICYAIAEIDWKQFDKTYPELATQEYSMWRKSFSERGELLFIHAGRGVLTKESGERMDFLGYLKEFNQKISTKYIS